MDGRTHRVGLRRRKRTGRGSRDRGVALILVIGTLAIMAAVAVDFRYSASVDLQLAANARDDLRAEYLARSAVNLSRLLLRFQRGLDGQANMAGALLTQVTGSAGAGAGLNIRLWEIVPIECSLFSMILGTPGGGGGDEPAPMASGDDDEAEAPTGGKAKLASRSFGDFQGCFQAKIEDEEQKINVNRLNLSGAITGRPPMVQALMLLADPRFEWVFQSTDAHGVKMTPQEVLIALHDWIDERDTSATLGLMDSGEPFLEGFGDENQNYGSKYPHRYRVKNAPFDSLDELYQVDGVSDLFMDAFRDRLTVYPDPNDELNINTNDRVQQIINIYGVAANPNDPKLHNPLVIAAILEEISLTRLLSFLGMSTTQFVQIVERNGIAVRAEVKQKAANNNWIGDKSQTFTVKATGQAGRVERTITAVIRTNEAFGKVLYFREE